MTAIDRHGFSATAPARDAGPWWRSLTNARVLPVALVTGLVLAGLLLRVAAAQGDLWLDELWSLDLVAPLRWPGQVFWAVPHDNNHPLNSLWLAIVGPGRPAIAYRVPAIIFGTATIAAAARFGWRTSPVAAVAAAALTAFAYPLVLYGSEARGYAGLMLAVVLAVDLWSRLMERRDAGATMARLRGARWRLAAVVLLGASSHFTMLGAVAVLGVATVLRRRRRCGIAGALDEAVTLFQPVVILLAPLIAAVATGALAHGGFVIGDTTPFSTADFTHAYGELLASLIGVRGSVPAVWAIPIAGLLLAVGFMSHLVDRRALPLATVALVILPAALFLAQVGNTGYPRYFLCAGLVLPLLLAQMAGRLWTSGGGARDVAVLLVVLPCLGQVEDLRIVLQLHRGSPAAALALVEPGAAVRVSGDRPFAAMVAAAHFAAAGGHAVVPVAAPLPCDAPPRWLFRDSDPGDAVPLRIVDGGRACPTDYDLVRSHPTAPWSGRVFSTYRRAS